VCVVNMRSSQHCRHLYTQPLRDISDVFDNEYISDLAYGDAPARFTTTRNNVNLFSRRSACRNIIRIEGHCFSNQPTRLGGKRYGDVWVLSLKARLVAGQLLVAVYGVLVAWLALFLPGSSLSFHATDTSLVAELPDQ